MQAHGDILLAKLGHMQEIELEAHCVKGENSSLFKISMK